jgi:hypothetical protein
MYKYFLGIFLPNWINYNTHLIIWSVTAVRDSLSNIKQSHWPLNKEEHLDVDHVISDIQGVNDY